MPAPVQQATPSVAPVTEPVVEEQVQIHEYPGLEFLADYDLQNLEYQKSAESAVIPVTIAFVDESALGVIYIGVQFPTIDKPVKLPVSQVKDRLVKSAGMKRIFG